MHLRVNRELLLQSCQLASGIVSKDAFRPALACVLLKADDNGVTMAAFNMQVGLHQSLDQAEVIRPGRTLIPLAQLAAILKASPAEFAEIEVPGSTAVGETGQTVILRLSGSQCGEFHFPQVPVEEFPEMPSQDQDGVILECAALSLAEAIEQITFAVPQKDYSGGWNLQGSVLWESSESNIDVVATDGRRLSASRLQCQVVEGNLASVRRVVPDTSVYLLQDLLRGLGNDERVRIAFSESAARFFVGTRVVYSSLSSGRFPDHHTLLNQAQKKNSITATLLTESWFSALRQVRAVADKEERKVICDFQPNRVTLSTRGQGSGSVELDVPDLSERLRIAFDIQYLLEFLTVAQKQEYQVIVARFSTPEAMVWFSPKFNEDTVWNYLLMPMQV